MILPGLTILLIWAPVAAAWGVVGHEIVATIAQIHLHPSTVEKLCSMLPNYALCHLAPIAAWADKVRPHLPWSAHMHYIGDVGDHPSQHCAFGEGRWEDERANVLVAVRNTTRWLLEEQQGQEEALKFLVHFIGDLHMPLHLTGRDRGGNDVKVKFDGRVTNLHSVWDSRLIAKFIRTVPTNYTRPLPSLQVENALRGTIYDPYIREIMWEGVMGLWKDELDGWLSCHNEASPFTTGNPASPQVPFTGVGSQGALDTAHVCPFNWGKQIHQLNCEIVWPAELDELYTDSSRPGRYMELDTANYSGLIKRRRLIEKLLAMAGIRLAGILNSLYAT